jgi:hypothetical protein
LVDLTIDGAWLVSQLWNIRRIFIGRWRSLRSLSFGNVSSPQLEADVLQGTIFLKAHPCLEHLAFFGSLSGYSDGVSSLQLMPLPQLQAFTGKINQLKEISTTHLPSLQSLRLSYCFSPEAEFAPILEPFPSVTSLAVCVHFEWPLNGDEGFFKRLLSSCRQLTHVEISSTSVFRLVS